MTRLRLYGKHPENQGFSLGCAFGLLVGAGLGFLLGMVCVTWSG